MLFFKMSGALVLLGPLLVLNAGSAETPKGGHCSCASKEEIALKKVEDVRSGDGFLFLGSVKGEDVVTEKSEEVFIARAPKATVIAFVSAKCPCSASHEIALKKLYDDFSNRGIQFIGIHSNLDEPCDITKIHFEKSALPFSVIQDRNNQYADAFSALKTPHAFVISPSGSALFQGGIDDSHNFGDAQKHYLRDALMAIVEGKVPPLKSVRTLGCVIKR